MVSSPVTESSVNLKRLIRYQVRYVSNTALKEDRIDRVENGKVYLNYVDRKKIPRMEVLSEELFLRRL